MKTPRTGIRLLDSSDNLAQHFKAGVSLHCHTQQSREVLDFVPYYASRIPVVASLFHRAVENHRIKRGEVIDFAKAFWTPPLPPRVVMDAESEQIEHALGLEPIVSITDHDDIRACTNLQVLCPNKEVPVSFEWTLPFAPGFFHLGVHNLPRDRAPEIWQSLKAYTAGRREPLLSELFETLNQDPRTLIVLNHPLWDIERIGESAHLELLREFLGQCGSWIHAIEVNGFRSWDENKRAMEMAAQYGYPVISGGDRHGHEPNAMLNLTTAKTFSEFAEEVRADRLSEVAVLPAYKEPLAMRMLEAVGDVLRYYPNHPQGQRFWTDRIFWTLEDLSVRPLSFYWGTRGPAWVRASMWVMRIIGSRRIRPAMRLFLADQEGAWS